MDSNCALGLLDSGVGGLTVVKELFLQLPAERIIYFGDTARMPYGQRDYAEVRQFALQILHFLNSQNIKLAVVACNSATAAGLPYYQSEFDLPFIGVIEPGIRAALRHTRNRRIGVIGTAVTINSGAYELSIRREAPDVTVFSQACPMFVLMVENGLIDTPEALWVAEFYLRPLREAGIDTLILGCTHYPLMEHIIARVMGPDVLLISSAREAAAEVRKKLISLDIMQNEKKEGVNHCFYVSGNPNPFIEIGEKLLGRQIQAYQILLP